MSGGTPTQSKQLPHRIPLIGKALLKQLTKAELEELTGYLSGKKPLKDPSNVGVLDKICPMCGKAK